MDDLAWDDDGFDVALPAAAKAPSAGGAPTAAGEGDQFAGEDEEEEAAEAVAKEAKPKKANDGKAKMREAEKAAAAAAKDGPLDDPVAEKLRLLRLQEEADLKSAKELFGVDTSAQKDLTDIIPKSVAEFEEYGLLVAATYVKIHEKSANYASLLKGLIRRSIANLRSDAIKEVESAVIAMRNERLKEEKAAVSKKKGADKNKKKSLNAGALDEVLDQRMAYDEGDGDDYDFM